MKEGGKVERRMQEGGRREEVKCDHVIIKDIKKNVWSRLGRLSDMSPAGRFITVYTRDLVRHFGDVCLGTARVIEM